LGSVFQTQINTFLGRDKRHEKRILQIFKFNFGTDQKTLCVEERVDSLTYLAFSKHFA
jgi:hypothetical protein